MVRRIAITCRSNKGFPRSPGEGIDGAAGGLSQLWEENERLRVLIPGFFGGKIDAELLHFAVQGGLA